MTRSRVAILEIDSESDDGGIGALAPMGVSRSVSFSRTRGHLRKKAKIPTSENSGRSYSLRNRSMDNEGKGNFIYSCI